LGHTLWTQRDVASRRSIESGFEYETALAGISHHRYDTIRREVQNLVHETLSDAQRWEGADSWRIRLTSEPVHQLSDLLPHMLADRVTPRRLVFEQIYVETLWRTLGLRELNVTLGRWWDKSRISQRFL
jgi:hypothetical protein